MLTVTVPSAECFDEATATFVQRKEETLVLEHSLVSVSKWEAKWCKPFLGSGEKTDAEVLDYIRCMAVSQNHAADAYSRLAATALNRIVEYINAPMTATRIPERGAVKNSGEAVTSELIYYWMIAFNIPMECQKWHLKRLLTLIRVCAYKNTPHKKRSRKAWFDNQRALNEARRSRLGTKG
jgi:hypothetical protein